MEAIESEAEPDPAKIADIDVRVWVDGPGQPETRVPTAIRERVREMDAPQYAAGLVRGRLVALAPPAAERLATCVARSWPSPEGWTYRMWPRRRGISRRRPRMPEP